MKISNKYHLPANQIDFANVNLSKDNLLFIDPLRIRNGATEFHKKCYHKIEKFVNKMIELSKGKEYNKLLEFMENFCERNETRLGYSIETNYGKSFGTNGGESLIKLFSKGKVFETGFIEDIFDFSITVHNIEKDKVSDLITAIIFEDLIKFTQEQCEKWKIPTENTTLKKLCWNDELRIWEKRKENLPIYKNEPIVFVPKSFVGKEYLFSYETLYRDVIIPLYKGIELQRPTSEFVVHYKNGRIHVLGNELRKKYPCTKYVILDFLKKYDLIYREYKNDVLNNNWYEGKIKKYTYYYKKLE